MESVLTLKKIIMSMSTSSFWPPRRQQQLENISCLSGVGWGLATAVAYVAVEGYRLVRMRRLERRLADLRTPLSSSFDCRAWGISQEGFPSESTRGGGATSRSNLENEIYLEK